MTETLHQPATAPAAAVHPAYEPAPSIPRLITDIVHEEFWLRYAQARGDAEHFDDTYLAGRRRTALLLRAVITDLFALDAPADRRRAADAAAAANAVRRVDWQMTLPVDAARAWLRDQYEEWENGDDRHLPNCPGGCRGSGIVVEPVIWQDDGVAVHAEPVDCLRGEEADPHGPDCACRGAGRVFDLRVREYWRCDAYEPASSAESDPEKATVASPDLWGMTGHPF
ncbi:hypothetical protein ACH4PU_30660 [Streptomyces sp. NPDC021100]|uniref:hypothetical protein n=1 Tax=Streptomyces sp. NPDC021100 TaxID=3365114 RepID=UPI003789539D